MKTSTTLTASIALTGILASILGCANWSDSEGACVTDMYEDAPPIWLPDHGSQRIFVGERDWSAVDTDACRIDADFITEISQFDGEGAVTATRTGDTWTLRGTREGWVDLRVVPQRGLSFHLKAQVYAGLETRYQWADDHLYVDEYVHAADDALETRKGGFALLAGRPAYLDIVHDRPGDPGSIRAEAIPEFDGAPWTVSYTVDRYVETDYYDEPLEAYRVDVEDAPGSYSVGTSGRAEDALNFDVVEASEIDHVKLCQGPSACIEPGEFIPLSWYGHYDDVLIVHLMLYTADGKPIFGELPEEIEVTTPAHWMRERRDDRSVKSHSLRLFEYEAPENARDGQLVVRVMGETYRFDAEEPYYY